MRRGARALAMHTEASHRFERGADVAAGPLAISRLAHLLAKIGAGTVRPGLVEAKGHERPARTVRLRPARVSALLGVEVPRLQQVRTLESLGFLVTGSGPEETVLVPSWRLDVSREADLAEEVGRHFGLQRIEAALPPASRPGRLRPSQRRERRIRDVLTGVGLVEVVNYAFAAGAQMPGAPEERRRLANPLTEEQDTLRTSLVVPGLLDTLRTNLRLGRRDVAIFELGRVFTGSGDAPREERRLAVLLSGSTHPHHWSMKPRPFDLFDIKGVVELLFERLGEPFPELDRESAPPLFLHPGRAVSLRRDGTIVGYAGALHPDVRAAWELKDEAVVVELGSRRPARGPSAGGPLHGARPLPGRAEGPLDPLRRGDAGGGDRRPGARGGGRAPAVGEPARPLHRQPGPAGQGQPDGEPALPGPGAHADERRGAGSGERGRPGAPRRRARDPGRVRERHVEDSFKLLEDRIHRAAERLKTLSAEGQALRAELAQAKSRAEKAEQALAAAREREGAGADEAKKAEALARELSTLKRERVEIRDRIEKLVGLLESL